MLMLDFTEHCPYCGTQVIRAPYSANKTKKCHICGRTFVSVKLKPQSEKSKPFFRSKGEAVLAVVAIIILLIFIFAADVGWYSRFV